MRHAARLRTMCAYQRTCALQGDEAVNSGAIDNESNCQHLQSSTRYEANPPGTDDLGALQRTVCNLAFAKALALAAGHALHCIPNHLVRTHPIDEMSSRDAKKSRRNRESGYSALLFIVPVLRAPVCSHRSPVPPGVPAGHRTFLFQLSSCGTISTKTHDWLR